MKLRPLLAVLGLASSTLIAAPTLEQLVADPKLWPAEVTVTGAAKATVIRNGQPGGMMLVGAGKKITVMAVAADGVTGKLGGDTVRVPVDKTDLLQGGAAVAAPVVAAASETSAPVVASRPSRMQRQLNAKLVRMEGGKLVSINTDTALAGVKYYALYFSASWCGPCRQFTPQLVRAYRDIKAMHPEFELVFMSADRSARDMAAYVKEDSMPWPAMKYELVREGELHRYGGPGIPCLVLVDASGRVLADSYDGDNYLGPGHVLNETQRILRKGI